MVLEDPSSSSQPVLSCQQYRPPSLPAWACVKKGIGAVLPKRPPLGSDPRSVLRAGASRNRAPGRAPDLPNRAPGPKIPLPALSRTVPLPRAPDPLPPTLPHLQPALPSTRNRAPGALPNQLGRSLKMSPKKSIFLVFFVFIFIFLALCVGPRAI